MWWQADAQDLHQVSDRISSVYVERCHIDRDENAVVLGAPAAHGFPALKNDQ